MTILKRPGAYTSQEIADRAAVRELAEFERFCRDNELWEEMKKCFLEESTVAISWYQGSGWGFVDASEKMVSKAPHKLYNIGVWLNEAGDKAVAVMQMTIEIKKIIEGFPAENRSDSKMVYRMVKREGMWYILSMEAIYEKDSLIPVYPCALSLPKDALKGFRPSYACLSYILRSEGYDINTELPGVDRPETVKAVYQRVNQWLEQ